MSVKLLIADDEDIIRRGIAKYIALHSERFDRLYEAENGEQALELALKYQPELILLDVQMPVKSGIDVMKELARAGLSPVIVILSGYDEFDYARQALRLGAKEYLLKPVRAADILSCLNKMADLYIGPEESVEPEGAVSNHFVKEAQEYILEHYTEDLSLTSVAEQLGITGGYLSTMFGQSLGCGFGDYLTRVRIERACCYLEQNSLKTYEIAYKVGFRDEKYFSKVFKKLMGVSPREYRQAKK